jgi:endonuclease YncB( thermonuclease family)
MRPGIVAGAVVVLLGIGAVIFVRGQALIAPPPDMTIDSEQPVVDLPETGDQPVPASPPEAALEKAEPAPDETKPARAEAELERIAPREPLGDLGQPSPPPPKQGGDSLYRPLSPAAGRIEAMGYSIRLAGIEPLEAEASCDFEGKAWPCGMRARSAFRAFLRGRAVNCDMAAGTDKAQPVTTSCRLGKQDLGEWLVENGWARAQADGPYVKLGEDARAQGRGLYGPPPKAAGLSPLPLITPADPPEPFQ